MGIRAVAAEVGEVIRLEGRREIVLVRYPWSRAGEAEDGCEVIEGFVRQRRPALMSRPRRASRYITRTMAELTHVDSSGKARMVDVSGKRHTARSARATGAIVMKPETLQAIRTNSIAKGDVLGVARVAGIMAAKKTPDLVPLCHQLPLSGVQVDFEFDEALPGIRVSASVTTEAQTGVEMEAIMAISVTLVTLYDMAKGVDKGMSIGEISLQEKRGGKSGDWVREA